MGQVAPLKKVLEQIAEEHEERACRLVDAEEPTARMVALANEERRKAEAARLLARGIAF